MERKRKGREEIGREINEERKKDRKGRRVMNIREKKGRKKGKK